MTEEPSSTDQTTTAIEQIKADTGANDEQARAMLIQRERQAAINENTHPSSLLDPAAKVEPKLGPNQTTVRQSEAASNLPASRQAILSGTTGRTRR